MSSIEKQAFSGATDPQASELPLRLGNRPTAESVRRILLVDPDEELGRTRSLLLESLGHPVDRARNFAAIYSLHRDHRYCLVAVSVSAKISDLSTTLTTVRSSWPAARILLLGSSAIGIEDYQYDEMVNPAYHPADLVEVAHRLISVRPFTNFK
jgi:CheY-like chemotaxis protein